MTRTFPISIIEFMSLVHSKKVSRRFFPVTTVTGPWISLSVCRVYLKYTRGCSSGGSGVVRDGGNPGAEGERQCAGGGEGKGGKGGGRMLRVPRCNGGATSVAV